MVDSVSNNAAISSLLRAQTTSASAAVLGLKSSAQATQAVINQLQKSADLQKNVTTQLAAKPLNAGGGNLPRGSLVDITA